MLDDRQLIATKWLPRDHQVNLGKPSSDSLAAAGRLGFLLARWAGSGSSISSAFSRTVPWFPDWLFDSSSLRAAGLSKTVVVFLWFLILRLLLCTLLGDSDWKSDCLVTWTKITISRSFLCSLLGEAGWTGWTTFDCLVTWTAKGWSQWLQLLPRLANPFALNTSPASAVSVMTTKLTGHSAKLPDQRGSYAFSCSPFTIQVRHFCLPT